MNVKTIGSILDNENNRKSLITILNFALIILFICESYLQIAEMSLSIDISMYEIEDANYDMIEK